MVSAEVINDINGGDRTTYLIISGLEVTTKPIWCVLAQHQQI